MQDVLAALLPGITAAPRLFPWAEQLFICPDPDAGLLSVAHTGSGGGEGRGAGRGAAAGAGAHLQDKLNPHVEICTLASR